MRLRVLDTGLAPARWNVAASAALLAGIDEGGEAVLRFHRYPLSCVVGRFQDVEAELDLDACAAGKTVVARRMTGGGAVVMGPGILAFDLVLPGSGAAMGRVTDGAGEALVATLADLGLAATRPTTGSVAIGGLKVSGSAGRLARRAVLHQATLILDLKDAPSLSLLRRRTEGGRPTVDPRHRVTDIATALRILSPPQSLTGTSRRRHPEEPAEQASRRTHPGWACFETRTWSAPHHDEGVDSHVGPAERIVMNRITQHLAETFRLEPHPDTMSDKERAHAAAIFADTVGREDFVLTGDMEGQAA